MLVIAGGYCADKLSKQCAINMETEGTAAQLRAPIRATVQNMPRAGKKDRPKGLGKKELPDKDGNEVAEGKSPSY
ncbi:hypothetical protein GCM10025791_27720 [Halioxenophilus aromaticivorans]|uniref:Uncharacterized protein n=1 Tax=Halioxenophilus aromaticivorans TaxID=1306992 RepID=A0AAV3U5D0_9ALTE